MANWEKLNKEFDDALDSMTSEDWELLASKRIKKTTRTMKTAVEQIIDEFNEELQVAVAIGNKDKIRIIKHLITIAKLHLPMEKERLEDAYRTGIWDVGCRSASFEEYYNRTFKQEEK
jgi:hypothetical protein